MRNIGIYPVKIKLYECWKRIFNIQYTGTDQYPNKGDIKQSFTFMNVTVYPRKMIYPASEAPSVSYTRLMSIRHIREESTSVNLETAFLEEIISESKNTLFYHIDPAIITIQRALNILNKVFTQLDQWTNIKLITFGTRTATSRPTPPAPIWEWNCPRWLKNTCHQKPDILIFGPEGYEAEKLFHFLQTSSSIQATSLVYKEGKHFFVDDEQYFKGPGQYQKHFQKRTGNNRLDVVNGFGNNPLVHKRVASYLPNANIIIILRDPLETNRSKLLLSQYPQLITKWLDFYSTNQEEII